jgi:hypothetical protein
MLAVGIHKYQSVSLRYSDSAFYGGTIADIVGMTENFGAGSFSNICRIIRRSIIDNDFLRVGVERTDV